MYSQYKQVSSDILVPHASNLKYILINIGSFHGIFIQVHRAHITIYILAPSMYEYTFGHMCVNKVLYAIPNFRKG